LGDEFNHVERSMKTAVIVGQNQPDFYLQEILNEHERVIVFEPLPDAASACRDAFKDSPELIVFQAACGESFGNAAFNVYNMAGLSSSLGTMSADAVELYKPDYDLSLRGTIEVQVMHLGFMLQLIGVSLIDLLFIDAQGMDFAILKTVEPWLAESRVKRVQMEADGEGFRHYHGLPDNSEAAIREWMLRFPQYSVSCLDGRRDEQPDLFFELTPE
jgi:FkbM family methyltransferase